MNDNPYETPLTCGTAPESPDAPLRSRKEVLQQVFRLFGAACGIVAVGFLLAVVENNGDETMLRSLHGLAGAGGMSIALFYLARIMPDY